jgi:hypothetical protein
MVEAGRHAARDTDQNESRSDHSKYKIAAEHGRDGSHSASSGRRDEQRLRSARCAIQSADELKMQSGVGYRPVHAIDKARYGCREPHAQGSDRADRPLFSPALFGELVKEPPFRSGKDADPRAVSQQ